MEEGRSHIIISLQSEEGWSSFWGQCIPGPDQRRQPQTSAKSEALGLALLLFFFATLVSLLVSWDNPNSSGHEGSSLKSSALFNVQHEGGSRTGQSTENILVWQLNSRDLLLSAACSSAFQLYKFHLLRSLFISDDKRLWIFHHGWASESGKDSRSSLKEGVMQMLWKAGGVEPSSKRSGRHIYILITSAQLGTHLLALQQHFPSIFSLPVGCSYSSK